MTTNQLKEAIAMLECLANESLETILFNKETSIVSLLGTTFKVSMEQMEKYSPTFSEHIMDEEESEEEHLTHESIVGLDIWLQDTRIKIIKELVEHLTIDVDEENKTKDEIKESMEGE